VIGYYDFPECRAAFATGQKDARLVERDGCLYRLRGRTHNHWTLLSFQDAYEAWRQLSVYRQAGDRVQAVNFTSPVPQLPIVKGPAEWFTENFEDVTRSSGAIAQAVRRYSRKGVLVSVSAEDASKIFLQWMAWAKTRHFMVFRGHYESWLRRHFSGESVSTSLLGVADSEGWIEGIFGFEESHGIRQVTVAKHTPRLHPKTLWAVGLAAAGAGRILCGSTADKLKHDIGLSSVQSWTFDLRKLA